LGGQTKRDEEHKMKNTLTNVRAYCIRPLFAAALALATAFTLGCGEHAWEEIFGDKSSSSSGEEDDYSSSSFKLSSSNGSISSSGGGSSNGSISSSSNSSSSSSGDISSSGGSSSTNGSSSSNKSASSSSGDGSSSSDSSYGLTLTEFSVNKTTVSQNQLFAVSPKLKNTNTSAFPGGQVGAALVDNSGKIAAVVGIINFNSLNAGSSRASTVNSFAPESVKAGQYKLRIVAKPTDGEWKITTLSSQDVPTAIDFTVKAETGAKGGGYGLSLTSFTSNKTAVSQKDLFTMSSTLKNLNLDAFAGGQVGAALMDNSGNIAAVLGTINFNSLNAGSSRTSTVSSFVPGDVNPGQYKLRTIVKPTSGEWRVVTLAPDTIPTAINLTVNPAETITITEEQKIEAIKTRYKSIPTSFTGGYFITTPTITPSYTTGQVKNEVLQTGIDAVNLVRYIAGVPDDIELDAEYTDLCQHGAVLLTAVDQLTHTPSKPANMEQAFFDKGYKGTSSSNLAYDSQSNLPARSVFLYMDDSDAGNIDRLGHRRWVLNPSMKKTGFGVAATKYGAMYSFDKSRSNVYYDYVAWPSPGVFPTNLFSNNHAWHISVNTQMYGTPDINKIGVTLKHTNSGKVWTFSNSTPSSTATRSTYFNVNKGGYGISNAIIFRPALESSFQYQKGDVFQVTVSGLDKDLSYTVKMFAIDN
jgi:hypothetical protein